MSRSGSSGVSIVGVLTIVFIILKLTKLISWSWMWVLAPIWISAGIALFVVLFCIHLKVMDDKTHKLKNKNVTKP